MTDDKQDEVMEWLSQEHCWARSDARERINDTVNIIRAQKDRIAELEDAARWRVVADGELPEIGQKIEIYNPTDVNELVPVTINPVSLGWLKSLYYTHWRPLDLPEQP